MERIKDLFKVAIEFERDTVIFYEMIRAMIEYDETSADLNQIIEEETRHIDQFQRS
jgi:rubrerythrin